MKYKVIVREILEREVLIDESEAENEYQAIDIVQEQYDSEDIVLDSSDYIRTEFECGRYTASRNR